MVEYFQPYQKRHVLAETLSRPRCTILTVVRHYNVHMLTGLQCPARVYVTISPLGYDF